MKLSTWSFVFILIFSLLSCGEKENNTTETTGIKTKENDKVESTESTTQEENTTTEEITETTSETTISKNALHVYLNDPDKSGTNIRKTPKGDVVMQLIPKGEDDHYFITLSEVKDGWFKIEKISGMEVENIEIEGSEGWIHGSVLGVDTRNYGRQTLDLLDAPKSGKVVGTIKEEVYGLKLKDMDGEWVKVEYKGVLGWINSEWLCGNPLTTCS